MVVVVAHDPMGIPYGDANEARTTARTEEMPALMILKEQGLWLA